MNSNRINYDCEYSRQQALKFLCQNNQDKEKLACKQIQFLEDIGRNWLLEAKSREDITGQLKKLKTTTEKLLKQYEDAYKKYGKSILLAAKAGVFSEDQKISNDCLSAYTSYCERLQREIEALDKAKNQLSSQPRNSWVTSGLSNQDEFVGMCHHIFNEFRPNEAAINEDNDFNHFCQEIFSLVHKQTYEKSLMGSLKKILKRK